MWLQISVLTSTYISISILLLFAEMSMCDMDTRNVHAHASACVCVCVKCIVCVYPLVNLLDASILGCLQIILPIFIRSVVRESTHVITAQGNQVKLCVAANSPLFIDLYSF